MYRVGYRNSRGWRQGNFPMVTTACASPVRANFGYPLYNGLALRPIVLRSCGALVGCAICSRLTANLSPQVSTLQI